jgi:hypothetical protein
LSVHALARSVLRVSAFSIFKTFVTDTEGDRHMASLQIVREEKKGTITLRLEGVLNGEAAAELGRKLNELETHQVVIDFSHVREFIDAAVPAVIRAIESKPCQLQGLVRHHVRMFRYFGHTTPQLPEQDFGIPEDRVLM